MLNHNFAMKSVGPPTLIGIILTIAISLWILSDLSQLFSIDLLNPRVLFLFLLAVIPIGEYVVLVFWHSIPVSPKQEQPQAITMPNWRWLVLPVATTLVLTALLSGWPMFLRFSISKSAFEQTVDRLKKDEDIGEPPYTIGAFQIEAVVLGENGEIHFDTGRVATDPAGITYDPANPPSRFCYRRFYRDWYGGLTY